MKELNSLKYYYKEVTWTTTNYLVSDRLKQYLKASQHLNDGICASITELNHVDEDPAKDCIDLNHPISSNQCHKYNLGLLKQFQICIVSNIMKQVISWESIFANFEDFG